MSKKKLLILLSSFSGGGAERVTINLANHFYNNNIDVSFLVFSDSGEMKSEVNKDIKIYEMKSKRARYSLFTLSKKINEICPDIVFSTLGPLNIVLLMIRHRLKSKPKIICREANFISIDKQRYSVLVKHMLSFLYKIYYPKADVIVAQCEAMKEEIENFCEYKKKSNVVRIYNPVNDVKIDYLKKEKNVYNSKKINLVTVGRLTYQKGYDMLIDIFAELHKEYENANLHLVGTGEMELELKNKVKTLNLENEIIFHGYQSNPYVYIEQADCFLLSSRWEGFPNVLIESIICETPIVSFNCKSGPNEIIPSNGVIGELVECFNENEFAEKIKKVLSTTFEKKSFYDCRQKYLMNEIAKEYEKIFFS